MGKDGVVFTPIPNGTFLAGITRKRVIGVAARCRRHASSKRCCATPISKTPTKSSATGNDSKVLPVTRIGERSLQPGPFYRKARELYWAYAHS